MQRGAADGRPDEALTRSPHSQSPIPLALSKNLAPSPLRQRFTALIRTKYPMSAIKDQDEVEGADSNPCVVVLRHPSGSKAGGPQGFAAGSRSSGRGAACTIDWIPCASLQTRPTAPGLLARCMWSAPPTSPSRCGSPGVAGVPEGGMGQGDGVCRQWGRISRAIQCLLGCRGGTRSCRLPHALAAGWEPARRARPADPVLGGVAARAWCAQPLAVSSVAIGRAHGQWSEEPLSLPHPPTTSPLPALDAVADRCGRDDGPGSACQRGPGVGPAAAGGA